MSDPGKTRLVIGAPDTLWPVIILAVRMGGAVALAEFAGGHRGWTLTATLTLAALCIVQRVVLTREGIRVALIIPLLSREVPWSRIQSVGLCDNDRTVLLQLDNGDSVLISTWFLRRNAKELATICAQWHAFNRKRTCNACGYDLFGIQSKSCPECGQPIELPANPNPSETP